MRYPGGKNGAGTYQKIINLMPPHERYIEPFLGGGAVMRLKRPATMNIGLDLVASQLSVVSAELVKNGVAAGSIDIDDGGRRRSPVPAMGGSTRLFSRCAIAFLEQEAFTTTDLIYCDPPYRMQTRSGRRMYQHEMSDVDHRRFLRVVMGLPCMVMISGYWSSLYAEALQGWNSIHFEAMTRGGSTKTEWLWFNFPRPTELHDYRYLGEGFRERERIKRKKTRWTNRLRRMPTLERQALLAAIAETAGTGESSSLNVTPAKRASPSRA